MIRRALPALFLFCTFVPLLTAADRPNFVWIVSEDNSIHYLRHFFPGGAGAPAIESLAAHGLTFDHAFSNAPVCSVARTTLATCCYGPRIGTQFHRRYQLAPMPEGLNMFQAYLRRSGYYTTNNSKKDYNAIEGDGVWDESSRTASWRNRPDKAQPFFHMQSHPVSHESSLHFSRENYENQKTAADPQAVPLADCYPDTRLFRYTHARYLDRMADVDRIVADTVSQLEEDGLLEDTFVFYFGDHGGVLPASKGYLFDRGLHVPLVIRIPQNFRNLVDASLGERIKGSVSFIDFGPTVLHLAGITPPSQVDGRPFLGTGVHRQELNSRDESFGYADRFDEKYDLVRSLHKGKFHYLRCYQPYLPDGLQNNYRYKNLAYTEWRDLWKAGKLSGPALSFYEAKPVEQLYDLETDPYETRNLAGDPKFAKTLVDLRDRLQRIVKQLPDLSFYPESFLVKNAMSNPVVFGQEHRRHIERLVDIADLALLPYDEARSEIRAALRSPDPMQRYWGAMVCSAFGQEALELVSQVEPLAADTHPIVRLRALEFLGIIGRRNPQPELAEIVNTCDDPVLATEVLNSIVFFRDFYDGKYPIQRSDLHPVCEGADIDVRLNYINGVPYPPRKSPLKKGRQGKKKNGRCP